MEKAAIVSVLFDQQSMGLGKGHISRLNNTFNKDNEIVVLSGVRRCGKSTLLQEIRSK